MNENMKTTPSEKRALIERMKELNCLYDISKLFSHYSLSLEGLLREIVRIIPKAWQYPERTLVRISHNGREYRSKNCAPNCCTAHRETIGLKNRPSGFVEVGYLKKDSEASAPAFLEDEKRLLKAIAELLSNIIAKKEAEMSLKKTTDELRKQTAELENKNIALKELISSIGLERKALQDQLRMNIELTVLPFLNKMQNSDTPPEAWQVYLKVVLRNLEEIASSFNRRIIEERVRLSPREFEICNLIKNGLSNKDIAELLKISLLTVERHRHNVRKKLRIDNEKVNLATYLRVR
jgi:DNA-binding CsgD family transcriptional regulator